MEELIKLLKESELKKVAKDTGIPYDRMWKWISGKAKPKTENYNTLMEYFKNGKSSIINKPENQETEMNSREENQMLKEILRYKEKDISDKDRVIKGLEDRLAQYEAVKQKSNAS